MLSNHLQNGFETAKLVWSQIPNSEEAEHEGVGLLSTSGGSSSVESLDYEVIENYAYREEQAQRGKLYVGYSVVVKWFFALLIGIGTGLAAVFINISEKGLPNTISHVTISYCEKLDALPNGMHKLQSLQYLKIKECPSILSFSEEGFPTNLKLIRIGGGVDAKMYKAVIQWGLHRLTSLIGLSIEECHDAESFPDEEMRMMLPASLTFLILRRLSKLKYLSSMGFQSLTSLEHLLIEDCPNLTSFPEVGLPSSLLSLEIKNCPKLRKQCKRDRGKEWSKIASIPCVKIDDKFIYDPEAE